MKQSGMLTIDGKKYATPIESLIALGDLGNGTCGHVVKMRHKESGKIVACKQMRRTGNSEETKRIVMDKDGVIHRDVKPSNILLDYEGKVKLCDFGISGRLVDSKAKTRSAGCAAYMAPERINPPNPNKPDYDIRADVWSLGITLVELATGSFPYKDCKTEFEVLTKVIQDDPPCLPLNQGFSR